MNSDLLERVKIVKSEASKIQFIRLTSFYHVIC